MRPLPALVSWLLGRAVPRQRRDEVIGDLASDYAAMRARRSGAASLAWLTRETTSLFFAYVTAPIRRALDSAPLWLRDLQLTGRSLRRAPVAALAAAAMLATGLVALAVTFGLAQTLLLRPVSAAHGDALRRIGAMDQQGRLAFRLSYPEWQVIAERLARTTHTTIVNMQPIVTRVGGADLQTMAEVVDGGFFALIGTPLAIGRPLLSTDDLPGAPPAAVISEPFWRRQFAASPDALGQTLIINGHAFAIVGVARAIGSSSALGASVDAWLPLAHGDAVLNRGWRHDPRARWFTAFALPAADLAAVDAGLAVATRDLIGLHPELWRDRRLTTVDGRVLTGAQRTTVMTLLLVLGGLALLILVTAAANLAGVLLARTASLRRQIAIHLSIGASRAAIVRRQLLEGAAIGAAAAAVALALYTWVRAVLTEIALLPTLSLRLDLPLDAGVLSAVATAGVAAGALLSAGPAVWASRLELSPSMHDGGARTSGGRGFRRARRVLVTAQVALSFALIVGAALFMRTLAAMENVDLGFARDGLMAMDFDLEPSGMQTGGLAGAARDVLTRVEAMPGVVAAAMSNRAPVDQSTPAVRVRTSAEATAAVTEATFYLATDRYFSTVGLPLVAGRPFTRDESATAAPVVIVNQSLASRLRGDGDVVERQLFLGDETTPVRIVGIARDSRYRSLSEAARAHVYRPTPPALGLTLLVRTTDVDPHGALGAVQRVLDGTGPGVVGFFPRTLDDHLAIDLLPTQAAVSAATTLGSVALALSAVALYGLVAWFVELRRREIAVRLALGAAVWDVRRLVLREALAAAAPGILAGAVVAAALASGARRVLFGVTPLDPVAFAAGAVGLLMIVGVATYLPARRATAIDPAATLRG